MEIFKDINGYKGIYQISNLGNVKSLKYGKTRLLKKYLSKGYYRVSLSFKGNVTRPVTHRLVAENFIPNYKNKPCVNHIDGNKENNHISNLEWCTYSENEIHSYKILNKINHNRKLNDASILDIKNNCIKGKGRSKYGNVIDFMNKYKVDRTTILNVLNNKYYV